jgi:DNA-binding GntR family transcriptional regulator
MAIASGEDRTHAPASLKDFAAREIRQRVLNGDLRPGQKVDQDTLAEDLGISKLPVREALISLGYEGIIDHVARRGAFVTALSRDDIRDHYVVFGLVGGLAAERAAASIGPADLAHLDALAGRMESGSAGPEQDSLNFEFHRVINLASESRRLISILGSLGRLIPHGWFESHGGWAERAHIEHREILGALERRDGEAARRLTQAHFAGGGDVAVQRLESHHYWT